ncbi:MAG: hypothetical protein Ta2E_03970 [Mycoplasmoidaceae bacterium]|nr:MAG: hypothetical protein Ta2E_03970 [Mycoplasmoidaceae bacterium]
MLICRFLINFYWILFKTTGWRQPSFYPDSAKLQTYIVAKWLWLVFFIIFFVSATLFFVLRVIYLKLDLNWPTITFVVCTYGLSLFALLMFMICACNKYYKIFVKTLQYIGTLNDSKLIANELNKLHDYKILNETQWQIYKFWYVYQKDIPWTNKTFIINAIKKKSEDKRLYISEVFELVKDL